MPAPEKSILDSLFSCNTPMGTELSKFLATQESQASLAFSDSPDLTPWQLRDWRPSNLSRAVDGNQEPKTTSSWDWEVSQISSFPLVQDFLSPKIDPDLDPTLSATLSATVSESIEETGTEKLPLEPESSSTESSSTESSFFDMRMSTLGSTLGILPHSKLHSKFQSKLHSRTHSKFQATFQAIVEESERERESEMESEMESEKESEQKSRPLQKSSWISQSTISTMDSLFGASASSSSESIHHANASPWDPPKCSSKLWGPSKSHRNIWGPFDKAESTEKSAWGLMDLNSTSSS